VKFRFAAYNRFGWISLASADAILLAVAPSTAFKRLPTVGALIPAGNLLLGGLLVANELLVLLSIHCNSIRRWFWNGGVFGVKTPLAAILVSARKARAPASAVLANALHQTSVAGTAPFQPQITDNSLVTGSPVRVMPVSFFWLRHLQSFAGVDACDIKTNEAAACGFLKSKSDYFHSRKLLSR
jgi:hypothetical protein